MEPTQENQDLLINVSFYSKRSGSYCNINQCLVEFLYDFLGVSSGQFSCELNWFKTFLGQEKDKFNLF